MFANFYLNNTITSRKADYCSQYEQQFKHLKIENAELKLLFSELGGCTIDRGLMRFHTMGSSHVWTDIITNYFYEYKNLIVCFAFDWLGRQFAVSKSENVIYMFDPATAEVNELKESISEFLDTDMVDYKSETFNSFMFNDVIDTNGKELEPGNCLGFKVPLFLGGKDESENYEIVDTQVYWELNYQIYMQIRNIPTGKLIKNVWIE